MKKILLSIFVIAITMSVNAQIKTPAASPGAKIEQKVGLTDVSVQYSRPAMRGRTIFGGLVPYNKIWRTGANARTTITFSDAVVIGGKTLKAGTYAIFTKPQATKWEVFFYSDYAGSGAPQKWDDSKVAASVIADVIPMGMDIQSFTISIDDVTNTSAVIGMLWEKSYVGVSFEVPTEKGVMASIAKTMNGPGANDYYAAAGYYFNEGKDINKATTWIDKAVLLGKDRPRYWIYRTQALIHAKAGDKKGAIKAAKISLELATKAKNDAYVQMNKASLKEWGAN